MSDLLIAWLHPEGFVVIGMIYVAVRQHISARLQAKNAAMIAELALNTNSIQTALNVANLAQGKAEGKAEGRAEILAGRGDDTVKGA